MDPGLYLVGTPIGNLQDITLRALDTLRGAALILAEDTRVSRVLLDRHGIAGRLLSYHKFNEAARADEIVSRIRSGEAIALVTDSGMPAVSDPGARLVAACRAAGLAVTVIPGPSAVTSALALAGWESAGFVFGGFLPHKPGPRRRQLAELDQPGLPVVLFESPYRLLKLMGEVEAVLGAREVYVGRELTKKFEESLRGPPAAIRAAFEKRDVKGELVVVIAPRARREPPPAISQEGAEPEGEEPLMDAEGNADGAE
jgi:16S rRNA (cytidine1402-2'-O)-methyltransferase